MREIEVKEAMALLKARSNIDSIIGTLGTGQVSVSIRGNYIDISSFVLRDTLMGEFKRINLKLEELGITGIEEEISHA